MKFLLYVLVAISVVACESSPKAPVTEQPTTTTTLPATEPASHEVPFLVGEDGMKRGGTVLAGKKSIWEQITRNMSPVPPARPKCQGGDPVIGALCVKGTAACDSVDGQWQFQCNEKTTFKVFGWVYDVNKATGEFKPLAGVKADIFSFAGCMIGICNVQAGPAVTDEWGYFEILTGTLDDQVRLHQPDGYYAVCNKDKPIVGRSNGGSSLPQYAHVPKAFSGAFKSYKINDLSCK